MTNEEILKKAIEKSINNGWKMGNIINDNLFGEDGEWSQYNLETTLECGYGETIWFLYDNDFAKAFFGEEQEDVRCEYCKEMNYDSCPECEDRISYKNWEKHLQIIVLEEDPIKYLEKFI